MTGHVVMGGWALGTLKGAPVDTEDPLNTGGPCVMCGHHMAMEGPLSSFWLSHAGVRVSGTCLDSDMSEAIARPCPLGMCAHGKTCGGGIAQGKDVPGPANNSQTGKRAGGTCLQWQPDGSGEIGDCLMLLVAHRLRARGRFRRFFVLLCAINRRRVAITWSQTQTHQWITMR